MSSVLVDQAELARIEQNLLWARYLLEGDLLVNLLSHPIRNTLIEVQVADLISQVDQLHRACVAVRQNLFGVETSLTQNHNFLSAQITQNIGSIAAAAFALVPTQAKVTAQTPEHSYTSNSIHDLAMKLDVVESAESPRVRIDMNQSKGYRNFVVYIPGIQNLGLPNANPLDIASSVAEFTGKPNSAETAVRQAMKLSGIGEVPTDRVTLVGHSLGGLIASQLANDKKLNVSAVVTFGSPNEQIDIPKHIPVLNVVHENDPVTYLDGINNTGQKVGTEVQYDWVSHSDAVERRSLIPSHMMLAYEQSSIAIDRSQADSLDAVKNALRDAYGDGKVELRYFEIGR